MPRFTINDGLYPGVKCPSGEWAKKGNQRQSDCLNEAQAVMRGRMPQRFTYPTLYDLHYGMDGLTISGNVVSAVGSGACRTSFGKAPNSGKFYTEVKNISASGDTDPQASVYVGLCNASFSKYFLFMGSAGNGSNRGYVVYQAGGFQAAIGTNFVVSEPLGIVADMSGANPGLRICRGSTVVYTASGLDNDLIYLAYGSLIGDSGWNLSFEANFGASPFEYPSAPAALGATAGWWN